ncbi:MAG: hypothetical protein ACK5LN_12030 [Propioniciclava sp.]
MAPPRSHRIRRIVAWLLIGTSVLSLARLSWIALAPLPADRTVPAQVAFLAGALDRGAGRQMQTLFPEGEFFTHALTGLAAVPTDSALARSQLATLDADPIASRFGNGMSTEHGIFHAGWSLALAVAIAAETGDPSDVATVADRAPAVHRALTGAPTGIPASYPGRYWPCDAVVAAASLAAAADLLGETGWLEDLRGWRDTLAPLLDPTLGLLPHRVTAEGEVFDGPRGSSQAIIQAFWPSLTTHLDGGPDLAAWSAYRDAFVVTVAGLVGVREYPIGSPGAGDVDSGPLVVGVSLSASAVTLAAARAVGDTALASDLDREAELFGLPAAWGGTRRYAAGLVPVGDAFLAWARAVPMTPATDTGTGPRVGWMLLGIPAAVLLLGGLLLLPGDPRHAHWSPATSAASC